MRLPLSAKLVLRRVIIAGAIAGVGTLTSFGPGMSAVAYAHDAVLHSSPEDGSTVDRFPRTIVLEFSGIPKDNFNTIAVTDSDTGDVLFSAEPHRDKQVMSVTVPDDVHPGPGHYIVGFQITSSDGHATRGKTTFTVASAPASTEPSDSAEETPDPEATTSGQDQETSPQDAGVSLATIVGIMALVAVCGGVIVTMKKRK